MKRSSNLKGADVGHLVPNWHACLLTPFILYKELGQGKEERKMWRSLRFSRLLLFLPLSVEYRSCHHDHPRDAGRCLVQRGPAGRAAPPRPAAMHRASAFLHHVPGNTLGTTPLSFLEGRALKVQRRERSLPGGERSRADGVPAPSRS